jgi:hypothetical protein
LSIVSGAGNADAQIKRKPFIKKNIMKIQPYVLEARTLQTSLTQGTLTLSSGVRWDCKGTLCTAHVKYPSSGTKACNALARAVGSLHSFRLVKQPSKIKTVKGYPLTTAQINACNQGAAIPQNKSAISSRTPLIVGSTVKLNSGSVKTVGTVIAGSAVAQAANRAKEIGIAGNRMKQLKELQRMQQSGSPNDPGRFGGTTRGRQDCARSANRAQCMRDNLSTGTNSNAGQPGSPSGQGLADCMNGGGNMRDCVVGNRGKGQGFAGTGTGTSGPGNPNDGVIIPGKGQAEGDATGHNWGPWVFTYGQDNESGTRSSMNDDSTQSGERHFRDNITHAITSEIWTKTREGLKTTTTTITDSEGTLTFSETVTRYPDGLTSTSLNPLPSTGTPAGPDTGEQTAPDSASGGRPDNCNWNPALARCTAPEGDPEGQTTQPGPDGEYSGIGDAITAPGVDIGAVINCGDTNTDACNRIGDATVNVPYNPVDPEGPRPD